MIQAPQIPIKKSADEIEFYKSAGKKFGEILQQFYNKILDNQILYLEDWFITACKKAFKSIRFPFANQENYLGEKFGHAICVSINDIIAHGKPQDKTFNRDDIISVDCGIALPYKNRWLNLDAAFTVQQHNKEDWVKTPQKALRNIISQQPKNTHEIAKVIRNTAYLYFLSQVVSLAGHGIGYLLHEAPVIHNAPGDFSLVELFDGLCFCAEPIFVDPSYKKSISQTYIGPDGWQVATVDGNSASHFETTFCVINGQIVDLVGISEWDI